MKTHSRTPQSHSQKTDSKLLTKFLVILGIFGVTTFVTYGAVSTPESAFMSSPYTVRSSTGDLILSNATNGQGAALLDAYIARILSGAKEQGGVVAYNTYLNAKLLKLNKLDDTIKESPEFGSEYSFVFSYIYPRIYEQLKPEQSTSLIGRIGSALFEEDSRNPQYPEIPAPAVTANDTTNTINGWDSRTMEASLSSDGGATYGAYSTGAQDLTENKILKVRLRTSDNYSSFAKITVLTFTANTTQQSPGFTFSAKFEPNTIAATGSTILQYSSNAAGGCNYSGSGIAGRNAGTANGNVTINASDLRIPAGTTTNTVRTVNFACYNANSTLAGTGSVSLTILAPPVDNSAAIEAERVRLAEVERVRLAGIETARLAKLAADTTLLVTSTNGTTFKTNDTINVEYTVGTAFDNCGLVNSGSTGVGYGNPDGIYNAGTPKPQKVGTGKYSILVTPDLISTGLRCRNTLGGDFKEVLITLNRDYTPEIEAMFNGNAYLQSKSITPQPVHITSWTAEIQKNGLAEARKIFPDKIKEWICPIDPEGYYMANNTDVRDYYKANSNLNVGNTGGKTHWDKITDEKKEQRKSCWGVGYAR